MTATTVANDTFKAYIAEDEALEIMTVSLVNLKTDENVACYRFRMSHPVCRQGTTDEQVLNYCVSRFNREDIEVSLATLG